jgi:hypothetical protein
MTIQLATTGGGSAPWWRSLHGLFGEIVNWDSSSSMTVSSVLGILAIAALVMALLNSLMTTRGGGPSMIQLVNAGWRMGLSEVLAKWDACDEEHHTFRHARWATIFDLIAELLLSAALLISIAVIRDVAADTSWIAGRGYAAGYIVLIGAVAVVLGDLAQLAVISVYKRHGSLSWAFSSLTMVSVLFRIACLSMGALYVMTGSASLTVPK